MGLNKIDAKVDNSVQRREISDNVISFAESALDPNVEAIRGAIEVKLAGFERHMPALLDILRSANRCRSAPGSFDSATVGRRLHGIAEFYFWRGAVKAVSASAPKSRLRTLKKTLAAACALIDENSPERCRGRSMLGVVGSAKRIFGDRGELCGSALH